MTDRAHGSSPSGLPPGVVMGLVASLAAALGVAAWSASHRGRAVGDRPLEFRPIAVDHPRLDRQRQDRSANLQTAGEEAPIEELLTHVRRLNGLQFDEATRDRQTKLAEKISYLANDVIEITGYDAFIAAGRPLFERCRTGLQSLLADVRSGDVSLETARTDPDPDAYGDYRRNCGNLLPTLLERGLIDGEGRWTRPRDLKKTIVDILQRYRWANIIRTRRPPLEQLTEYERRLLMRWRIEDSDAYSLRERRNYLDRLADNPGLVPKYNVAEARARLAYAERDLHQAVQFLKDRMREQSGDAARYRQALEWLERHHGNGANGTSGAGGSTH